MNTYSASRIQLYISCRAQFYDRYVLKHKDAKKDTSGLFGSALHSAIENYYARGLNPYQRFQRYINLVYNWYTRKGYEISHSIEYTDMFTQGKVILDTFPWQTYSPRHTEYKFNVPLINPTTKRAVGFIMGYMDMITDDHVVDFKSGKTKPSQNKVDNDIQLALYYYAYGYLFGEYPKSVVRHHLRDHTTTEYKGSNIDQMMSYICGIVEQIESDNFLDVAHGRPICNYCAPWCGRKGNK